MSDTRPLSDRPTQAVSDLLHALGLPPTRTVSVRLAPGSITAQMADPADIRLWLYSPSDLPA